MSSQNQGSTQSNSTGGFSGKIVVQQDDEFGCDLMYVEDRKDCKCCGGMVNNCAGEACANLGICYCVVADEEDL